MPSKGRSRTLNNQIDLEATQLFKFSIKPGELEEGRTALHSALEPFTHKFCSFLTQSVPSQSLNTHKLPAGAKCKQAGRRQKKRSCARSPTHIALQLSPSLELLLGDTLEVLVQVGEVHNDVADRAQLEAQLTRGGVVPETA